LDVVGDVRVELDKRRFEGFLAPGAEFNHAGGAEEAAAQVFDDEIGITL